MESTPIVIQALLYAYHVCVHGINGSIPGPREVGQRAPIARYIEGFHIRERPRPISRLSRNAPPGPLHVYVALISYCYVGGLQTLHRNLERLEESVQRL